MVFHRLRGEKEIFAIVGIGMTAILARFCPLIESNTLTIALAEKIIDLNAVDHRVLAIFYDRAQGRDLLVCALRFENLCAHLAHVGVVLATHGFSFWVSGTMVFRFCLLAP